jgi:hypothetical protein
MKEGTFVCLNIRGARAVYPLSARRVLPLSAPAMKQRQSNQTMKKCLIALCITGALTLAAYADEDNKSETGKKNAATPEQKAARKALIDKYDTNKDGKIDKDERAKISEEDKAKLKESRANAANAPKKEKTATAK